MTFWPSTYGITAGNTLIKRKKLTSQNFHRKLQKKEKENTESKKYYSEVESTLNSKAYHLHTNDEVSRPRLQLLNLNNCSRIFISSLQLYCVRFVA